VLNKHNTVFTSKLSAIRAQAVYFLHLTVLIVPRACDWVVSALSAALLIFSIQFSLLFFYIGRQAALQRIGFNTQYRTSDVAENMGRYISCTERTVLRIDFELILTVKGKLDIAQTTSSDNEFRTICNRCVVMAAWFCKTLKFWKKCVFLENDPIR